MSAQITSGRAKAAAFIEKAKISNATHETIARKLFSFDHPHAFGADAETAFEIFNKVATNFKVSIHHVKAAGSAQLGYSFFKQKEFHPKTSDLDLAIIDPRLFHEYCEYSFRATKSYTDLTKFPRIPEVDVVYSFLTSLARGYFRPDYMPICFEREAWARFFSSLSTKHMSRFKDINCGIYFSESFFEAKQMLVIDKYLEGKRNDKV